MSSSKAQFDPKTIQLTTKPHDFKYPTLNFQRIQRTEPKDFKLPAIPIYRGVDNRVWRDAKGKYSPWTQSQLSVSLVTRR